MRRRDRSGMMLCLPLLLNRTRLASWHRNKDGADKAPRIVRDKIRLLIALKTAWKQILTKHSSDPLPDRVNLIAGHS